MAQRFIDVRREATLISQLALSAMDEIDDDDDDNSSDAEQESAKVEETEPPGEVDIVIHNVMACFSVRCALNLKEIARRTFNVEHQVGANVLVMRFRSPRCTARITSKGEIAMVGAQSEEFAKIGARRCARIIQKLGYKVRFSNYRTVNALGTCRLPFGIRLGAFWEAHRKISSYESDIHPALTLRIEEFKASLQVYYMGKISVTAPSVANIQSAIETAYVLLTGFKKQLSAQDLMKLRQEEFQKRKDKSRNKQGKKNRRTKKRHRNQYEVEFDFEMDVGTDEEEVVASDEEDKEEIATTTTTSQSEEGEEEISKNVVKKTRKPKRKKLNKIVTKSKKKSKTRMRIGTDTETDEETEEDDDDNNDDDDSDYIPGPQAKKLRYEVSSSSPSRSSPKPKYSLRKSIRSASGKSTN